MSHSGIGLMFTHGPGLRPQVLYIRDIEAHCPDCGKEHFVRYYSDTPWHSLTLSMLEKLLHEAADSLTLECDQCGAEVTGNDALRWTVHYGFPGDLGMIQGFARYDGARRWLLSPHRRLDVQQVLVWEPDADQSNAELDALDDATIREVFGRSFNPKEAVREYLLDGPPRFTEPRLWQLVELADGLALVAAASADSLEEALQFLELERDWSPVPAPLVIDGVAQGAYAGAPSGWLRDLGDSVLQAANLYGVADSSRIADVASDVVGRFPLPVKIRHRDGGDLWMRLPNVKDPKVSPHLVPREIAFEAARSMTSPADVTRLEIDRVLYGVTGAWEDEKEEAST